MLEQMLGKSEAHARLPLDQGLEKIRAVKKASWIHSHNDEDRPVPLWDALAHGMLFIEPDVIHRDGDLYVAHNERDIHPSDTLSSLYLAPLFDCLRALYPDGNDATAHGVRGIFPQCPKQTLYLVIDFKFGGQEYLDTVMQKLEPLRRGGWLSRVEDGKLIESSLTICLSGRWEPLIDQIQAMEPRFVFIDGPLMTLGKDSVNWTSLLAPIASGNPKAAGSHAIGLDDEATSEMRDAVDEAHRRGIKARWWGLPEYPSFLRKRSWNIALSSGADILNADYLPEAVLHLDSFVPSLKGDEPEQAKSAEEAVQPSA